jgi:uncharacterized protein YqgC (DUF456 family)
VQAWALVLLVACALVGLLLIPLGLPGLWVIVGGVLLYGWLTGFSTVGVWTMAIALGLAFFGEAIEWWLGFRIAQRYGGSQSAGWGALIGGMAGAIVGVPVPVIGSVIGAFVGSFLGAVAFEYLRAQRAEVALRAGWGAVVGRAVAAAAKMAIGLVIGVLGVFAALRG